jgi:hypothetical protein
MPATAEALLIAVVFVMPGFIFVRTREWFVPPVAKSDALRLTLTSITVSLVFVPLWVLAAGDLLDVRRQLTLATTVSAPVSIPLSHRGLVAFFALALLLPVSAGFLAAIAFWQDWYPRVARRILPRVGIPPPPVGGLGDDVWDKLWLNFRRQMWLTVRTKEGPIYVGRGVEFRYTSQGRDLRLGNDTRVYDDKWTLIQDISEGGGLGVWIPAQQVVSIEIYDPPFPERASLPVGSTP